MPCEETNLNKMKRDSFHQVFESVLFDFSKDYGEIKLNKIRENLLKSKYVYQALNNFEHAKIPPSVNGLIKLLGNSFFFTFGHKRNIAIGGTMFLYIWNEKCNKNNEILSDKELVQLLDDFYKKVAKML